MNVKITHSLLFAVCFICSVSSFAQVGINILHPDSSAVLQLESTKRGLGLPRLTSVQRDSIQNPLKGLTIFNTQDSLIEYWNGQCWLKTYQKNCYECAFNMTIDHFTDTLDRTVNDSVFATITIHRTNGNQKVNVIYIATPPQGVGLSLVGANPVDSTGTLKIIVKADIFAGSGAIPILIQAFCGDEIHLLSYNVYIDPCVLVTLGADQIDYDLQANNSLQLPAGSKHCVVVNVLPGVELHADTTSIPAYSTGNLDPQSIVGIINNGAFLGRGGNGAFGGTISGFTVPGYPGLQGGDAMSLTTRTIIQNYGKIYAGGGGGGSVGLTYTFSIPVIGGNATLGAGLGGGGGSESGRGGQAPPGLNIGFFYSGNSATPTALSVPGTGASANTSIGIPIFAGLTVNLNPAANGGNGGAWAQTGTGGSISLGIQLCGIPFVGCVTIINPSSLTATTPAPVSLGPGQAIKTNGNPMTGIPTGTYNTTQVKGVVN